MNITAIIVTYNPNPRQLKETVSSIINQVSRCVIVDNGNTVFDLQNSDKITIINLEKNYGIAYAQNRGIELAKQNNADFIVLSDQDTVYPENYAERNLIAYRELKSHKLAALAPVFYNSVKNEKSPVLVKKFLSTTDFSAEYIETASAIASGTFIPVDSLREIGGMDERLFIDYVDFEWCWRATALGYKIFTISDLLINHDLGDESKKVFGKSVTVRSDTRYYYMIRNGCYLVRYCPFLNRRERVSFSKRLAVHIIGIIFLKRNIQSIRLVISAMLAGLLNRMGLKS